MRALPRIALLAALFVALGAVAEPTAGAPAASCQDGTFSSGSLWRICRPEEQRWNGRLIVYAHGYVRPDMPLSVQTALPK